MAEAAQQKAQGRSLLEVSQWVEENKLRLDSWVTVDDLKQLERGGRISKTAAAIGGLLNVKPIITVDTAGKLRSVDRVRGRNKAIQNRRSNHRQSSRIKSQYGLFCQCWRCRSGGESHQTFDRKNS